MEALSVKRVGPATVRARLEKAARYPTGTQGLEILLSTGRCIEVQRNGQQVGAALLEVIGGRLWVTAWAADSQAAGRDMTAALDAWLGRYVPMTGLKGASFVTQRRGLERKTGALGWRVHARHANHVEMRKEYP
jgi:hypothetical protein